ncbi:recombinase family protein [Succinimonas amylolytica]|uniref:recombinase family protein n=1 Tax=Succinimonas amylolytica TaxID=83769 RepID=UPI00316AE34E
MQYEQLESLETQRSHYDEYIRAHKDWELVNVYYDEGISGTRADTRPGLQRLMADCRLRRIDMVLTKSISRFARNTADCLALVRELISLNIPIHFEKEGIDTSAMESELLLSVMSSLAESESRSISENTKWSFGKQFRNGTFKVRTPPYGYRRVDGDLQIDPEEAQIVKRIFREAVSGKGASVIASGLNRDGIMSRQRKGWVHSTIFRILRNEVYTGDALYQKTFTDDEYRRHWNTKGEHAQFLATEHHDAIISREDDIEFAFCVMMNKLIFAGKQLLRPYLDEFKKNSSDAELKRIAKLEKELEKNTEKTYSVRRLMAGNYIPPDICNRELNTLKAHASKLKAEIAALEKSAEGSGSVISAIRELIAFTGENRMLTEFDGELFKRFVNRITVMDRNHISFELKCGLALQEKLE